MILIPALITSICILILVWQISVIDNEIRGLKNQVKMRDDRIEELLIELDKFDK